MRLSCSYYSIAVGQIVYVPQKTEPLEGQDSVFYLWISGTLSSIWHIKNACFIYIYKIKGEVPCPRSSIKIVPEPMCLYLPLYGLLFPFMLIDVV